MYEGYFVFGGTEIVNAARTEAYVRNNLPGFNLKGCQGCDTLAEVLEETYASPLQDDAEWVDPSNPATQDFFGFYPLGVEGFQSSTSQTTVVQSIGAGGYNNLPRDATREVRYRGVMIAQNKLALDAGISWLNEALHPTPCEDHGGGCSGSTICYYAACPELQVCYEVEGIDSSITLDNLSAASGLTILPNTISTDQRITGTITPQIPGQDGFTFTWGVSNLGAGFDQFLNMPLALYGPVTPQRTNYVRNPRFATDTSLWAITGGALTRIATGADDGGPYGQVVPSGAANLTTSIADAPYGPTMLQFDLRMPVGTGFTVNVRAVSDDSLIQSQAFSTTTDWVTYSLAVPFARENYLEFEATDDFDISMVVLEGGTLQLPYFDGNTVPEMPVSHAVNAPDPEYAVSWLGAPNASASRMVWLGEATYDFCGSDIYPWVTVQGGTGTINVNWAEFDRVSAEDQSIAYERHMHDVVCISGPLVTEKLAVSTGAACIVEFVLSAATPYAYSVPSDLLVQTPLTDLPSQPWVDIPTPTEPVSVIVDPDCPPVPDPPRPPDITNSCIDGPGLWDRYFFSIPADEVAAWQKMLPKVTLFSGSEDLRQVRVRLTPNPFNWPIETESHINLCTNPSAETVGAGGWAIITGVGGSSGLASAVATTSYGVRVMQESWSGATTSAGGGFYREEDVTPGTVYSLGMNLVRSSINNRLKLEYEWRTSGGSLISSGASADVVVTAGTTYDTADFKVENITAPPTAAKIRIKILSTSGTGFAQWSIGSTLQIDGVMLNEGSTLLAYFDGDNADSGEWFYGWTGTEDLSSSVAQKSAIDPYSYCAEFILSYLPADAELVVDGMVSRAWASVAGAAPVPASNLLYGTDGAPIVWPEMTCGVPYLFTVDVPVGEGDEILMSLSLTRRG